MPEPDDDIFKFNPTSFWKKLPGYERVDYISAINQDEEEIVLIPSNKLENQDKEQVQAKATEFRRQYNLFKKNLEPEQIKETAKWLRKDSKFLNLVAHQLAFHLIKLYEHLIKIRLKKTPDKSDSNLPSFTPILDKEGKLASVKLNLDETKINQILKHIKQDLAPDFEITKIFEKVAQKLLIYLSISATEKIKLDLGTEVIKNLNAENYQATIHQYLSREKFADDPEGQSEVSLLLQKISQRLVQEIAERLDLPNLTLEDLEGILRLKRDNENDPIPITESKLANAILPIPTFAALASAISAQIRKDKWGKDRDGIARFKHQAKGHPKNYIEHYISSPGDIEILPWEQAEQIIDKFGFNTVKLHLIFAAHTMNQPVPWSGKFSLKASDVIKYLGWDKRTDLPVHQKLKEIAKAAFVLDCLLVKSVWVEGRNKKGEINASTPTGRMWNVVVDPRGQLNIDGQVEKPKEVYITVQPGLIFHSFLNKAGSKLKEALYQFGYLAQDILRIDPYHDELALRLAIHLAMDSRIHVTGKYRVETLLKNLLPHTDIDKARSDKRKGYDLKQRWDNALKLLIKLKWQIQFDESYPSWLQPGSKEKKPSDARKMKIIEWLLQGKITIRPPAPIPELLATKVKPKPKVHKQIQAITTGITSDQIRKARNAKGWSQRKLAGWLGISQSLVKMWEKGKRTPSPEMEAKLRQLLEVQE